MSTDLTPDPEAPLSDSNASESESQPNVSAEVPVDSPTPSPAFPELPSASQPPTAVKLSRVPAPFSLTTVAIAPVVIGMGGVCLGAMNWRRLRKPARFWPTLLGGFVGLIIFQFLVGFVSGLTNFRWSLIPAVAWLISGIGVGIIVALLQRKHYKRWMQATGNLKPAFYEVGGCRAYLAAIGVGVIFHLITFFVINPAIQSFMMGLSFLTPEFTVSLDSFSITYDSSWRIYSEAEERSVNCGTQVNTECLLVAVNSLTGAEWFAAQMNRGIFGIAAIEGLLSGAMEAAMPGDYTAGNPETTSIDGHQAILRNSVAVRAADGVRTHILSVAIRDENKIIWMLFSADERVLPYVEDRFQRILDSIDFNDT